MFKYTGTFTIPEWSVAYLEYGDSSGLTPDEIAQIERFEARLNTYGPHSFEWGNDIGFCTSNDIGGLACNCVELHLYVDAASMYYIVDLDGLLIFSVGFQAESEARLALTSYQRLHPYNTAQIVKGEY